ncbi:paeninodin family lasso peptide [Roseibacterium sp. SDUM158016]|nr:paeninodin family lasso peptide [Roseibacterium sp. SDUM158016]MCU4653920.1 paeninodin family lasso peptide [Roseibacterium sp. SDUM158016]
MKKEYTAPKLEELDVAQTLGGGDSSLSEADFPGLEDDPAFPIFNAS